jgi:hypothetical protein
MALALTGCIACSRPSLKSPEEALAPSPIPAEFLSELRRDGARGEPWTKSALNVALRMRGVYNLDEFTEPSHTVSIEYRPSRGIVTIHEKGLPDDSVFEQYSVIELEKNEQMGYWIPIQYKRCWQGRGLSGWSTALAK